MHEDRAVQQRILVERYSRVLAERLVRQQVAVNAAAAASGRTLDFVSVAVQTSAAAGTASAASAAATSLLREVSEGAVSAASAWSGRGGGEEEAAMGAALRRRDRDAFQMLLDALHALPRPWLLSLPPRLLRVLAGEVRPTIPPTSHTTPHPDCDLTWACRQQHA